MLESESSALPFGDSPSYVSKHAIYNVSCKYFAQALSYYIIIFSKKQALFYKNFFKKQIPFSESKKLFHFGKVFTDGKVYGILANS